MSRSRRTRRKRSVIHIRPSRVGSFRAWARRRGLSMSAAIRAGLRSRDVRIRRKANFARNARKWRRRGR